MKGRGIVVLIAVVAIVAVSLSYGVRRHIIQSNGGAAEHDGRDEHDIHDHHDEAEHDGHDHTDCDGHGSHSKHKEHDDHGGGEDEHEDHTECSDHEGHSSHDEQHHEDIVSLTEEALELAGIEIDTVRLSRLHRVIELPGEVGFNEDRLVHITPRFGGVAKKVLKRLGDHVEKDERLAIIESNESMSPYALRAPIEGRIVEKHISNGEFVGEESSIFVIADLSDVWVNLAVYPKDAENVEPGQRVTLECLGNDLCAEGLISYVSHVYSEETRRLTARLVLPNEDGMWKPGMFVRATTEVESDEERVVVAKDAVQMVNDAPAVFIVRGEHEFEPVNVITGERGSEFVEIVSSGIELGDSYVSRGAFEIKAHLVTGSLDAHAGHGH